MRSTAAVHPRHLQVEDDHVGPHAFHLLGGEEGVGRGLDHETLFGREDGGERLAHDRRVVHHQDARHRGVADDLHG
jgi:hypothetical protein